LDDHRKRGETDKQILSRLCEIIEKDIEALQRVAEEDLHLRLASDGPRRP
jgi:hypothetical protein